MPLWTRNLLPINSRHLKNRVSECLNVSMTHFILWHICTYSLYFILNYRSSSRFGIMEESHLLCWVTWMFVSIHLLHQRTFGTWKTFPSARVCPVRTLAYQNQSMGILKYYLIQFNNFNITYTICTEHFNTTTSLWGWQFEINKLIFFQNCYIICLQVQMLRPKYITVRFLIITIGY